MRPSEVAALRAGRQAAVKTPAIAATLVLGLAALAYGASRWPGFALPPATTPAPARGAPGRPRPGPREQVQFTLYDAGIHPQEARVGGGVVVAVLIEDLTGGSAGLVVERETGHAPERVGQILRGDRTRRGRGELGVLAPGRYRVYDASHPENAAMLVVEP